MDEIVTFKLKKTKDEKVILFIVINQENINIDTQTRKDLVKKYVELVEKQDKVYLCIDTRKISSINPKILWEGASDISKYNHILKPKIGVSSVLICNKMLLDTVNLVNKVIAFASPTRFFSKNDDALKFINDN
tara:strand:+ start:1162 stop:1560 length:399 start_codon:yes stop_codon:yes gene_type:complete